jgi:hypothetical protein
MWVIFFFCVHVSLLEKHVNIVIGTPKKYVFCSNNFKLERLVKRHWKKPKKKPAMGPKNHSWSNFSYIFMVILFVKMKEIKKMKEKKREGQTLNQ